LQPTRALRARAAEAGRMLDRPSRRLRRPPAFRVGPAAGQAPRRAAVSTRVVAMLRNQPWLEVLPAPAARVLCLSTESRFKAFAFKRLSAPHPPRAGALARALHIMPAIMRHGSVAQGRYAASATAPRCGLAPRIIGTMRSARAWPLPRPPEAAPRGFSRGCATSPRPPRAVRAGAASALRACASRPPAIAPVRPRMPTPRSKQLLRGDPGRGLPTSQSTASG
jgi:hypothetical protein